MECVTFIGIEDRYKGITVDSQEEPCDPNLFLDRLTISLKKWFEDNKRCIWFKVDIKNAAWVPILANEGFNFHHSRDNFVMMYKWLAKNSSPNLPPACHTNLGVGGIVFNEKNQLLVVTEKHYEYPHWKLPGGYVERGEDLIDAAVREVKEETGIDATFDTMVTFRHSHGMMFGNSDIYVVVVLKAKSETVIKKSDIEIKACKWMDIEEYLEHPHVHNFNRDLVKRALDLRARKLKFNLIKDTLKLPNLTKVMTSLVVEDIE